MAMPTSAAASAGASLTPSPAIATTRPSRLQLCDHRALLLGQHLGLDLGDAEPRARPPRAVVRLSPVSMTTRMPSRAQRLQRRRRRRLDRIGDREQRRRACRRPPRRSTVAPSPRSRSASASSAAVSIAELAEEARIAEQRRRCRRPCRSRPCRSASRSPRPAPASRPRSCAARDDGVGQRMLAGALDAGGEPQQRRLRRSRRPATIATTFGLPSVSVPVLSTTSVSTFSIRSSASAFLISTPACAPRPTPTMIDIGVARPSAHGQAMISTLTAATSAEGEARLRPDQIAQATKASDRHGDHGRHEPAGDLVGQALDRRAAALRLAPPSARSRRASCRGRPCRRASRSRRSG